MTTYKWETSFPNPGEFSRVLVPNTRPLQSPITGDVQTVSRPGERWLITATWTNLVDSNGRADVLAFLERLNGQEHRIAIPEWNYLRRGALGGSPVVATAPAVGARSLDISGATASVTNWVRRGDLFRFETNTNEWAYRKIVANADSDASGDVTIEFTPAIRVIPAAAEVVRFDEGDGPHCKCVLMDLVEYSNTDPTANEGTASSFTAQFLDVGH